MARRSVPRPKPSRFNPTSALRASQECYAADRPLLQSGMLRTWREATPVWEAGTAETRAGETRGRMLVPQGSKSSWRLQGFEIEGGHCTTARHEALQRRLSRQDSLKAESWARRHWLASVACWSNRLRLLPCSRARYNSFSLRVEIWLCRCTALALRP